jgi:uncharacterized protein with ATP-grasp and redox domains
MTGKVFKNTFLIFILVTYLLVGCTGSQFNVDYKEFKKMYLSVTDVLDIKDPYGSIAKLNTESAIKRLDDLKRISLKIKQEVKSDVEKNIYEGNVSKYYDGVEFLHYASKNKDRLSEDERGRIATELTLVSLHRDNIKNGDI